MHDRPPRHALPALRAFEAVTLRAQALLADNQTAEAKALFKLARTLDDLAAAALATAAPRRDAYDPAPNVFDLIAASMDQE